MISLLLSLITLVPLYCSIADGQWGSAVLCVLFLLFIWGMHSAAVEDTKAYTNCRRYWAMSEEERERERRRARTAVDRQERESRERTRAQRQQKMDLQAEQALEKIRKEYETHGAPPLRERIPFESEVLKARAGKPAGDLFVCHYCGRYVRAVGNDVMSETGRMKLFHCPRCGMDNVTKIGCR